MNNYLPTYVYQNVFEIDYQVIKEKGIKNLIFDMDNTLISYGESEASLNLINLNKKLKSLGFNLYIISNNKNTRIIKFREKFPLDGYLEKAGKPGVKKIKKYFLNQNINLSETLFIGDQLVTDVLTANRLGTCSCLVKSIDRSTEKWYTVINRSREPRIIQKLIKTNPEIGLKVFEISQRKKKKS